MSNIDSTCDSNVTYPLNWHINSAMWQKCPICDGEGKEPDYYNARSMYVKICETCKGKRIISTITGKPPEDD